MAAQIHYKLLPQQHVYKLNAHWNVGNFSLFYPNPATTEISDHHHLECENCPKPKGPLYGFKHLDGHEFMDVQLKLKAVGVEFTEKPPDYNLWCEFEICWDNFRANGLWSLTTQVVVLKGDQESVFTVFEKETQPLQRVHFQKKKIQLAESLAEMWRKNDEYFPGDILRIQLKMNLIWKPFADGGREALAKWYGQAHTNSVLDSMVAMAQNMISLLESAEGADLILYCGDRHFFVHSLILAARSSTLATLIETARKKAGAAAAGDLEATVSPHVTPKIFDAVLYYIYGQKFQVPMGTVTERVTWVCEMIVAAQYFKVDGMGPCRLDSLRFMLEFHDAGTNAQIAVMIWDYWTKRGDKGVRTLVMTELGLDWLRLLATPAFVEVLDSNPEVLAAVREAVAMAMSCQRLQMPPIRQKAVPVVVLHQGSQTRPANAARRARNGKNQKPMKSCSIA